MPEVTRAARKLEYPADRRGEVSSILRKQNLAFGAGAETRANLDRLEAGAGAVVFGQQVGVFSGPAYSVYKARPPDQTPQGLRRHRTPPTPIFLLATHDHHPPDCP